MDAGGETDENLNSKKKKTKKKLNLGEILEMIRWTR